MTPELLFSNASSLKVLSCAGTCSVSGDLLLATNLGPSRAPVLLLGSAVDNKPLLSVVVLTDADAAQAWVGDLGDGLRRVVLLDDGTASNADDDGGGGSALLQTGREGAFRVSSTAAGGVLRIALLPGASALSPSGGGASLLPTTDGAFSVFEIPLAPRLAIVSPTLLAAAATPPPVPIGNRGNAAAPGGEGEMGAFAQAAVWSLELSAAGGGPLLPTPDNTELILVVNYTGDCGRVLASEDDTAPRSLILGDNFYASPSARSRLWRVPLTRLLGITLPANVTLRVLPLRQDAPLHIDTWPPFPGNGPNGTALDLHSVELDQRQTLQFSLVP